MKIMQCEMCGSNDLVKQDGLFFCQNCGAKYSPEDAKKMMVEGTVDVKGTVKIDDTSELENLYEIARRSIKTKNYSNALEYYNKILVKDPKSWEANFYSVFSKSHEGKIAEISNDTYNLKHVIPEALKLIKENVSYSKQQEALEEMYLQLVEICEYFNFNTENSLIENPNSINGYKNRMQGIIDLMYSFGDEIINVFGDRFSGIAVNGWKEGNKMVTFSRKDLGSIYFKKRNSYTEKIKKYDPNYEKPKKGNCYIATSVYGSYDCPEVWTLRRFRDNTLKKSLAGRLFIKTYYATSPTLVKYFGETKAFKNFFKPKLDKFVAKLQKNGFKSTPYEDY